MPAKAIPEGYPPVIPYLVVPGAQKLMDFIKHVFNAKEGAHPPFKMPNGSIAHAEIWIGESPIWCSDASERYGTVTGMLTVYVPDVDTTYKRAIEAGATSMRGPEDQFYGDRSAGVKDEFGNQWWIHTRIEDVSPEEMQRREAELHKQHAQS